MKNMHPSLARSHESASAAAPLVESARDVSPASFVSALTSRCSTLRDHQLVLASLVSEATKAARPNLSHGSVDKRLFETAKQIAELLALAERADERAVRDRIGARGSRAMRTLADTCFEAILSIDAARHELDATADADASAQRRGWYEALRGAQEALTGIERQVMKALAN